MSSRSRKKMQINKGLIIVIVVIVAIAAVSIFAGWYLSGGNTEEINSAEKEQSEHTDKNEQKGIKTSLEGTWVSNYDGAILTITGLSFTIENPRVDDPTKTSGKLAVEQNLVTFINTGGKDVCKSTEGHYQFTFEKDEVSFRLIKDKCESRKERMTVSWFRL